MEAWSREFGGDYELQIFGHRVVVLTGLADIRRMLIVRPSKMRRFLVSVGRSYDQLTAQRFIFSPLSHPLYAIFSGSQNTSVILEIKSEKQMTILVTFVCRTFRMIVVSPFQEHNRTFFLTRPIVLVSFDNYVLRVQV